MKAVILGGRWDGQEVVYDAPRIEHEGEAYVALLNDEGDVYYLLESMFSEWFSRPRRWQP